MLLGRHADELAVRDQRRAVVERAAMEDGEPDADDHPGRDVGAECREGLPGSMLDVGRVEGVLAPVAGQRELGQQDHGRPAAAGLGDGALAAIEVTGPVEWSLVDRRSGEVDAIHGSL